MKRKILFLASLTIIGIFLLVPFVQATSSQVWFDDTTEVVWRITEETLDASMQVTSLNSSYRKMNFTSVVEYSDNLTVEGKMYVASTSDVDSYGYTDQSIWHPEGFTVDKEIVDSDLSTKFNLFYNELNTDLSEFQNLPMENQTLMMMIKTVRLDWTFFEVYLVWALGHLLGDTFGHDNNETTITSIDARSAVFDVVLDFSIDDTCGGYDNITYTGTTDVTFGKTSNILLKSIVTSTLVVSEWNGTAYLTETTRSRSTHEIVYPNELVNDYPTSIPGYSVWILMGAMVLGIIPAYLVVKRKKK